MRTIRFAPAIAGALALLAVSSVLDSADARRGSGKGFHGGGGHARAFSGRSFHSGHSGRAFSGGSSFQGYRAHSGRSHHHHGGNYGRRFGPGLALGLPLAYGAYHYGSNYYGGHYGGGSCEWLRRRAAYSGDGYWWERYQACLDGYDY